MPGYATLSAVTPDTIERMLVCLPSAPDVRQVDRILERAGSVLTALDAAHAEQSSTWLPQRRITASRSIHEAFEAVNSAILALVIDYDVEASVERLTDALPLLRRAWVVQMLQVV